MFDFLHDVLRGIVDDTVEPQFVQEIERRGFARPGGMSRRPERGQDRVRFGLLRLRALASRFATIFPEHTLHLLRVGSRATRSLY